MRRQRQRGADGFLVETRQEQLGPFRGSRIGETSRRRHRKIRHAPNSRDGGNFNLGLVEEQELIARVYRRQGIAAFVALRWHVSFDFDAVKSGAQEAERQRQRIVLEHVARGFQQAQADRRPVIDFHHQLRARGEAWRITASDAHRRATIIRGIEVRRHDDIEGGAKQAPCELFAHQTEIA